MNQFWRKIWEMCLLRAAPQDLPASSALLIITICTYFLISLLIALVNLRFAQSLGAAAVDAVLLLFVSYVMMWIKVTTNRWYQMATSMAATSSVLGLIALPLSLIQAMLGTGSTLASFAILFLIGIMVWNLVVLAHIIKHAMDASIFIAALLAGFYMYLSLKIMSVLFFQAE